MLLFGLNTVFQTLSLNYDVHQGDALHTVTL